jgi:hypothetical protein
MGQDMISESSQSPNPILDCKTQPSTRQEDSALISRWRASRCEARRVAARPAPPNSDTASMSIAVAIRPSRAGSLSLGR